jgi:disulfide bond formation protein DsbB
MFIPPFLSFLVLVSNIAFFVAIALFIFSEKMRKMMIKHLSEKLASHIFFFSFVATLGSLAFSNIVGFPPCDLCWFQRIFMYPQAIISFVALVCPKIDSQKSFIYYLLPLSIIGTCISLYQSYIQWGGTTSVVRCTLDGGACGKLYVYAYGYITIPFMALSAFVYLLSISLVYIYGKKA